MIRRILVLLVSFLCWTDAAHVYKVNAASVLVQPSLEYVRMAEQTNDAPSPSAWRQTQTNAHKPRYLKGWLPQNFPNPATTEPPTCRNGRICDPDSVLTSEEMDLLVTLVQTFEKNQTVPCARRKSNKDQVDPIHVQLAIAMVKKMDLNIYWSSNDREAKAAESFCRSLHDTWGVGYNFPSCGGGTGIVVFFSVLDRALYISRGGALDNILTDDRLNRIIDRHMKPRFRQQRYSDGLRDAIDQIHVYLQQGPPSLTEKLAMFWPFYVVILFVFAIVGLDGWKKQRARQQYARVADQLRQLDRAKAEALQGQYHTTSCPICLEDFQAKPDQRKAALGKGNVEPIKPLLPTLPIGHDNFDETPTLLDSVKTTDMLGSDGLPLKLLQCGHVFDETCWADWENNKERSVTCCPICRQQVDGPWRATPAAEDTNSNDDESSLMELQSGGAIRQYQYERHFRLTRLCARYPDFVQPHQIQLWSQSTYYCPLAQDADFVMRNPEHQTTSSGYSSTGGDEVGISFGGGFSSGGSGGTW